MNAPAQFVAPSADSQDQRWRRWINKTKVDCPGFGCVQLGKHAADTAATSISRQWNHGFQKDDTRALLTGYQPDDVASAYDEPAMYAFNSQNVVKANGGIGWCTQDYPAIALVAEGGAVDNGSTLGPTNGSWALQVGEGGTGGSAGTWIKQSQDQRVLYQDDSVTYETAWIAPSTSRAIDSMLWYWENTGGVLLTSGQNIFAQTSIAMDQSLIDERGHDTGTTQDFVTHEKSWNGIDGALVMKRAGRYHCHISAKIWSTNGGPELAAWLTVHTVDGPTKTPATPDTEFTAAFFARRDFMFHDDTYDSIDFTAKEMVSAPLWLDFPHENMGFKLRLNYTPTSVPIPAQGGISDLSILVHRIGPPAFPAVPTRKASLPPAL